MTKITAGLLSQTDPKCVAYWTRMRAALPRLSFPTPRPVVVVEITDDAEFDVNLFRLRRRIALDDIVAAMARKET